MTVKNSIFAAKATAEDNGSMHEDWCGWGFQFKCRFGSCKDV